MATGVLPLVIGRATRLAQFLTASDKTYEATITFGRTTNTCDATGQRRSRRLNARPTRDATRRRAREVSRHVRADAAGVFREEHRRRTLLRSGPQGEDRRSAQRPKAVTVTAKRVEVLAFDGETARLEMQVTAGFYVRSLAHDLGDALGCGARLSALRRTRSGEFGLEHAVPLADVLQAGARGAGRPAGPAVGIAGRRAVGDAARAGQPGAAQERRGNGARRPRDAACCPCPQLVRLLGPEGDLVGLARPAKTPGFLHGWVVLG